jgi:hypothetical protein
MARQTRKRFLAAHDDAVFECWSCGEDVERDDVVVRHEESGDPDSPIVTACRPCHNENTGAI